MRIESHPGTLLINHLITVGQNCKVHALSMSVNDIISPHIWGKIGFITGFLHDFIKITPFFQAYLQSGTAKNTKLKSHALGSACLAYFTAREYLGSLDLPDNLREQLAMSVFLAIKRHHGNLNDFDYEYPENDFDLITKQFLSIDLDLAQEHLLPLQLELNIKTNLCELIKKLQKKESFENFFNERFFHFERYLKFQRHDATHFELIQALYGILLFSDKRDASIRGLNQYFNAANFSNAQNYRKKLQPVSNKITAINRHKNLAYDAAINNIASYDFTKGDLYSITLPTGLGKTLTSYAAASKILDHKKVKGRIIIAIPFTSIIDQNYEVYREIMKTESNTDLLKHHYLSSKEYKSADDNTYNERQQEHLIETWESGVIVTTFVQVLETIVTMKKRNLLRIHAFQDAVLILDEVQQIDFRLWPLVREALITITKRFNTTVLFVTATQPLMFNPKTEITELVTSYTDYFKIFDRTKLVINLNNTVQREELVEVISSHIISSPNKDILVIANTKKDVDHIYCLLKAKHPTEFLYYLSTNITPFERLTIINKIKKNDGIRRIIVSTQLVEAGVDFSVDIIFRALAPLDSIIQAAGRANRYQQKSEISDIYIYELEESIKSTNTIYGSILIDKTREVLKSRTEVPEREYLNLIESYFKKISEQSEKIDCPWIKMKQRWQFGQLNEFALISNQPNSSLFIDLNKTSHKLWLEFVELNEVNEDDFLTRKIRFNKIKSQFLNFVINIKSSNELPCEELYGFYYHNVSSENDEIYEYSNLDSESSRGFIFNKTNASVVF